MAASHATFMVSHIDHGNSRLTLVMGQAAEVDDEIKADIASRMEKDDIAFETSPIMVTVPSVDGIEVGHLVKLSVEL